MRAMDIGFSDRAVVYLNGQPLFAGRDDYRSRDYRFLGSIGYWDTVFLPACAGRQRADRGRVRVLWRLGCPGTLPGSDGITFKR